MTSRGWGKGIVAATAIVVGLIAASVWALNLSAAAREDRDDLDLFLEASSAGWAEVTKQFFLVPEAAAGSIAALAPRMDSTEDVLAILVETVRRSDEIDAAYIGYPDGSFLFAARSDEAAPGGFRTRVISVESGARTVELAWTDAASVPVRTELDPSDEYDPRRRPWYAPAIEAGGPHWTAPYVFSSSQEPGITHSVPIAEADGGVGAVVGVDLRLTRISTFLDELSPGPNGQALLVDNQSRVIAESAMAAQSLDTRGGGDAITLYQSPELRDLIDASGDTTAGRLSDGLRTTVVRSAGARDEWYLAVQALDEDFLQRDRASDVFATFAVGATVAMFVGALGFLALRYLTGLKEQAEVDELTGVHNRRSIRRHLDAALTKPDHAIEVGILDLDNFKFINDHHGHAAGDSVLAQVASRLNAYASDHGAHVGRLGGDEFVVFGQSGSIDWADLVDRTREPVSVDGHSLSVTVSVGVAESSGRASLSVEGVLSAADGLLFATKRHGGDGHRSVTTAAGQHSGA